MHARPPPPWQDAQRRLRELLGPVNQRIVAQALEALEAGDAQRLGTLMTSAQAAFDAAAGPLCPSQLTAPVLHMVLEYEPIQGYIWGGKGVGSQGDGTAQLLCKDEEAQRQVRVCVFWDVRVGACRSFAALKGLLTGSRLNVPVLNDTCRAASPAA